MQQRGRVKVERPAVASQLLFRETVQIGVHGREQTVGGILVARVRFTNEFGDVVVHALVMRADSR